MISGAPPPSAHSTHVYFRNIWSWELENHQYLMVSIISSELWCSWGLLASLFRKLHKDYGE